MANSNNTSSVESMSRWYTLRDEGKDTYEISWKQAKSFISSSAKRKEIDMYLGDYDGDLSGRHHAHPPHQIILEIPYADWQARLEASATDETKKEIEEAQKAASEAKDTIAKLPEEIKKGSKKKDLVKLLQKLLNTPPESAGLKVDGKFGNALKNAVIAYQNKRGITPANGVVTKLTWSRLKGIAIPASAFPTIQSGGSVASGSAQITTAQAYANAIVVEGSNPTMQYHEAGKGKNTNVFGVGKFDPASFKNSAFVDSLREQAHDLYLEQSSDHPNLATLSPGLYIKSRDEHTYVTNRFYIATGGKSAGVTISFQVLYLPNDNLEKAIDEIQSPSPDFEKSKVLYREYRAWNFLNPEDNGDNNPLIAMQQVLVNAEYENSKLEEKWNFDFLALKETLRLMNESLFRKFFFPAQSSAKNRLEVIWQNANAAGKDPNSPTNAYPELKKGAKDPKNCDVSKQPNKCYVKQLQKALNKNRTKKAKKISVDGDFGQQTVVAVKKYKKKVGIKPVDGKVGPEVWSSLLKIPPSPPPPIPSGLQERLQKESLIMRLEIARDPDEVAELALMRAVNNLQFSKMFSYYKNNSETINSKSDSLVNDPTPQAPSPAHNSHKEDKYKWNSGAAYLSGAPNIYPNEAKWLLYKAGDFHDHWIKKGKTMPLGELVETYIKPIPKKIPSPVDARGVHNDGDEHYKDREALQKEILTVEQKQQVHEKVMTEIENVSDIAFARVIQNSHRIKTPEDVYEQVLNAMSIDALIATVAQCMSTYLSDAELKKKICQVVLEKIDFEELDKLLGYMGTDTASAAYAVRTTILQKVAAEQSNVSETDSSTKIAVKNELLNIVKGGAATIDERDVVCAAIYASIPAAIYLLADWEAASALGEEIYKKSIKNPAKSIWKGIVANFNNYKALTLTTDWGNLIKNMIVDFITQMITESVSLLLREIAILCEGSAKSDFANMNEPAVGGQTKDIPDPVFPFTAGAINDAIDDDTVYEDLNTFADVPIGLIRSFLDALSNLLTLSELCTLLKPEDSYNKSLVLNKIWLGLLEMNKYKPLKQKLRNRVRLKKFFLILGKKTNPKYCVDKLANLEKTKKLLSELCAPTSNKALVEDLKNKASDAAIRELLKQEDAIANDLVNAINDITNPKLPSIFCGPETTGKGLEPQNKPLFSSQEHPSARYLGDNFFEKIFDGIVASFEKDIGFYKPILLGSGPNASWTRLIDASDQVLGAMAQLYNNISGGEFDLQDANGNPISKKSAGDLNKMITQGKYVASEVHSSLVKPSIGVFTADDKSNFFNDTNYLWIGTNDSVNGGDVVNLLINYGSSEALNVPPQTTRLFFGSAKDPDSIDTPVIHDSNVYNNLIKNISNTFKSDNLFDSLIQLNTVGSGFYSLLLEQIIKEHAEFISTQDLFRRSVFQNLNLQREGICEPSILDYTKILQDIGINAELLQCILTHGSVPTTQEVAQINAMVEYSIKVIIVQEFLKGLLVFSSFGIDSLLPDNEVEDSIYYKYLLTQILQLLGERLKSHIYKYSRGIYAAKLGVKYEDLTWDQVAREIIKNQFFDVKEAFETRLSKIDLNSLVEGVQTAGTLEDVGAGIPLQILKNIVTPKLYEPPPVIEIDTATKTTIIPAGFYSSDVRLKNGGFLVEEGFEIQHKFKGDENVYTEQEYADLLSDMEQIINPVDNGSLGQHFEELINLSVFGKIYFGANHTNTSRPTFKTDFDGGDIINNEIVTLAQNSGKLPRKKALNFIAAIKDPSFFIKSVFPATADDAVEKIINQLRLVGASEKAALNEPNRFFNQFSYYSTLNLLLPITSEAMLEKYQNIVSALNTAGEAGNMTFHRAALDRKYFIQEKGSETRYFKLPLLIFYGGDNKQSAADSENFNTKTLPIATFQNTLEMTMTTEDKEDIEALLVASQTLKNECINKDENIWEDGFMSHDNKKGLILLNNSTDSYTGTKLEEWEEADQQLVPKTGKFTPNGIWGLIDSFPTFQASAAKAGSNLDTNAKAFNNLLKDASKPENNVELPPRPVNAPAGSYWIATLKRFINTENGKAWFDGEVYEKNVKVYLKVQPTNKYQTTAGEGTYKDPKNGKWYKYHKYTINTATGLPSPPTNTVYWTGAQWIVTSAYNYAAALKRVYDIIEQFKPGVAKYADNADVIISIANSHAELLQELLNVKIYAKEFVRYTGDGPIAPKISGYKEFKLFEGLYATGEVYFHKRAIVRDQIIPTWGEPTSKDISELLAEGIPVEKPVKPQKSQYPDPVQDEKLFKEYYKQLDKYNNFVKDYPLYLSHLISEYAETADIIEAKAQAKFKEKILFPMANDPNFISFADGIQYKNLLSFLSIMMAELIEQKYSSISTLFGSTLLSIQAGLDALLNNANRNNDPNFYQNSPYNGLSPAMTGFDINWAPIVIEAIIKLLATTSDPTWRTPWFLPGPLTPIGVVAKILDGQEDDPAAATDGNSEMKDMSEARNICEPDESNS